MSKSFTLSNKVESSPTIDRLLTTFLSWSVKDVQNTKLYENCLENVPTEFGSIYDWKKIHSRHLLEETRATVDRTLENIKAYEETTCDINRDIESSQRSGGPWSKVDVKFDFKNTLSAMPDIESQEEDCDPDEEDEFDECETGGSSIRSLIGLITYHERINDGSFRSLEKSYFVKILMSTGDDADGIARPKKNRSHSMWILNSAMEDIRSQLDKRWTLYVYPKCSLVPLERIESGLRSLSNRDMSVLMHEVVTGNFHGNELTSDYDVPKLCDIGNNSQNLATNKVISKVECNHRNLPAITLVQGPPGTGKSTMIVSTIVELWKRDIPVCATAPTNFAVCEIAKRAVVKAKDEKLAVRKIVLCGSKQRLKLDDNLISIHLDSRVQRLHKSIGRLAQNYGKLLENGDMGTSEVGNVLRECKDDMKTLAEDCPDNLITDELRQLLLDRSENVDVSPHLSDVGDLIFRLMNLPALLLKDAILSDSMVLFCTVSGAAPLCYSNYFSKFQFVIVDEATQLVEAATSIILSNDLKSLILVGDDKQLPATVLSKTSAGLGFKRSLFERLKERNFPSTMLNIQYRMHPHISEWPSNKFYDGQLRDGDNVKSEEYKKFWHDKFPPIQICDVNEKYAKEETDALRSKFNLVELVVVVKKLRQFYGLLEEYRTTRGLLEQQMRPCVIGIISPYAAQVRLIQKEIDSLRFPSYLQVMCSSVDAFQGKECDVVIFSGVRKGKFLGFVSDMKRFNVAITRAKYSLVIVGNLDTLNRDRDLRDFLKYAQTLDHNSSFIREARDLAEKQLRQKESMWDEKRKLFEGCLWEGLVCFGDEFKSSVLKLSASKKNEIFNYILHLARGKWPKGDQTLVRSSIPSMNDLMYIHSFGSDHLVWCVDIKRQCERKDTFWSHEIKVLSVVSANNRQSYLERTAKIYLANKKSIAQIDFCKQVLVQNLLMTPQKMVKVTDDMMASNCTPELLTSTDDSFSDVATSVDKFYYLNSSVVSRILHANEGDNIQLPHSVSQEESELIDQDGPHFVLGRSGTGKTTVMLYRMLHTSIKTECLGQFNQLLVTASPILAGAIRESYQTLKNGGKQASLLNSTRAPQLQSKDKESTVCLNNTDASEFPLITTFDQLLRMIDLCLDHPFLNQNRSIENQIDFARFQTVYFNQLGDVTDNGKFQIVSATLFREIISVIKGGTSPCAAVALDPENDKNKCKCLSCDAYIALSERRDSSLTAEERRHIYNLFESYESLKARSDSHDYDASDFASHVYIQLRRSNKLRVQFQAVFVDEVQDLTMLQIAILRFCCSDIKGFFFAGDTAQTIAQGVSFRFEALKDLFYEEFIPHFKSTVQRDAMIKVPAVKQLKRNFRTHSEILKLANTIIKLTLNFFPESMDRVDDELSFLPGPKPIFLTDTNDIISGMFRRSDMRSCEFGADQVILVRDKAMQEEVKRVCGSNALVLTVYECKGMEFSDVLIYNFFSRSENRWRVIANAFNPCFQMDIEQYPCPKFNEKEHYAICQDLKMLYVLITRAKQRVFFFEDDQRRRQVMVDFWTHPKVDAVKMQEFNQEIEDILTIKSTPEEWCKRGHEFVQQNNYEQAQVCFHRGGDIYNMKLCLAKIEVNRGDGLILVDEIKAREHYGAAAAIYEQSPLNDEESAAEFYSKGKLYSKAGELFTKLQKFSTAGECYVQIEQWSKAGQNFAYDQQIDKAVDCYFKVSDYHTALSTIPVDGTFTTLRTKCVKKGAEHHFAKSDVVKMKHFVKEMDRDEKRLFLTRRSMFQTLIDIEIESGNFEYVGTLYTQQGNYKEACNTYKQGGNAMLLNRIDTELKMFRLENITDDLLLKQCVDDKTLKPYKNRLENMMQLLQSREEFDTTEIFAEIKFLLNDIQGATLQSVVSKLDKKKSIHDCLVEMCTNLPDTLQFRLPWLYLRQLLSSCNSTSTAISWANIMDVVTFFDETIVNKVKQIVKKLLKPVPKLTQEEMRIYWQLLDLFGLRTSNGSNAFPELLCIQPAKYDGKKIQNLWRSLTTSTPQSNSPTQTKEKLQDITELTFPAAMNSIESFVQQRQSGYHNILYAKAKKQWSDSMSKEFQPSYQFQKFVVQANTKRLNNPTQSDDEKYRMVQYLIDQGHQDESLKNDRYKLAEQIMYLMIDEFFFPMHYLIQDTGSNAQDSPSVLTLQSSLLGLYNVANSIQRKGRANINFEKHTKDILIMDHLSDESCQWYLRTLTSSLKSKDDSGHSHFNQYLSKLWQGKQLEITACIQLLTATTMMERKEAMMNLVEGQLKITKYLIPHWETTDCPFYISSESSREQIISPFTFLQIIEQTLIVLLLLLNGSQSHVFLTEKMFQQIILRSPRMKRIVSGIVQTYRSGYKLHDSDLQRVSRHANYLAKALMNTLEMPITELERWFAHCAKGSLGRSAHCNNKHAVNCYYMRGMQMMQLYHLNTNEFKYLIANSFKSNGSTLTSLPSVYVDYLKLREFSGITVTAFAGLAVALGDRLLELRVDSWRTASKAKCDQLSKLILHVEQQSQSSIVLHTITVDEYEAWEELQRQLNPVVENSNPIDESLPMAASIAVEDDDDDEVVGENVDNEETKTKFEVCCDKLRELAVKARTRYAGLSLFTKAQRVEESNYVKQGLNRHDVVVKVYLDKVFALFYELDTSIRNDINEMSQLLVSHPQVLAANSLIDDVYDVKERYKAWMEAIGPSIVLIEKSAENMNDESIVAKLEETYDRVRREVHNGNMTMNQVRGVIANSTKASSRDAGHVLRSAHATKGN